MSGSVQVFRSGVLPHPSQPFSGPAIRFMTSRIGWEVHHVYGAYSAVNVRCGGRAKAPTRQGIQWGQSSLMSVASSHHPFYAMNVYPVWLPRPFTRSTSVTSYWLMLASSAARALMVAVSVAGANSTPGNAP